MAYSSWTIRKFKQSTSYAGNNEIVFHGQMFKYYLLYLEYNIWWELHRLCWRSWIPTNSNPELTLSAVDSMQNWFRLHLSNVAGNFFEQSCMGTFQLRMGNTFLSGYFRLVVGYVSHLVAHWLQYCSAKLLKKLLHVSSPLQCTCMAVGQWIYIDYSRDWGALWDWMSAFNNVHQECSLKIVPIRV